ncbi:DUF2911 domain-containing protein [Fibrella aquatilis]|uniref:DUF2911 domain-containing protein n=1 Tax=Fibrella aquatilis TaxID=2817059 RepID=A0A939G7E4_9BACT|nr:DUF2911 domain-containing protein [Fibrella aquatilis]MBO0931143.1 DUF2911 domain-containing protein [Fibrella aquatilis]
MNFLYSIDQTTWLIIGGFALFIILVIVYLRQSAKRSPRAVAQATQNGITVKVLYCQPSKKGRTIFGGVVKYDKVWRTGANAATIIELAQDVRVGGNRLAKGRYSLYTIPTPIDWTVIINRRTGQWGISYKEAADVLRVTATTRPYTPPAEQFFISFEPQPGGVNMLLTWDETQVVVPIQKAA